MNHPARVVGPIEAELRSFEVFRPMRSEAPNCEPYEFWANLAFLGLQPDAATLVVGAAIQLKCQVWHAEPWSEAIEAAEALGL